MLIVEGSDFLGKTTLCHKMVKMLNAKRLPYMYGHLSRPPDTHDRLWNYVERMSRHLVQDRFHMSEIVYAAARGEKPDAGGLTTEKYRLVDAHLRLVPSFTVCIASDDRYYAKRWQSAQDSGEMTDQMYDLSVSRRANQKFLDLVTARWGLEYHPDFDEYVIINEAYPFVTDEHARALVDKYFERLMAFNRNVGDITVFVARNSR